MVTLRKHSSQKSNAQALQRRKAELEVENRELHRRLQRAELILDIQKKTALAPGALPICIETLNQALELYDAYQARVDECDAQIERLLTMPNADKPSPESPLPKPRNKTRQPNAVNFDPRPQLYQLMGVDVTQIHGVGPYLALSMISECGTDLSRWPSAKRFTSWLTLSSGCKIRGGKVLSARSRKTKPHIFGLPPPRWLGRIPPWVHSIGGWARIGKAKAVTASARKIAVLFYNATRFDMGLRGPGRVLTPGRFINGQPTLKVLPAEVWIN